MTLEQLIKPYVPDNALAETLRLSEPFHFELKITKSRITKLGDYRAPFKGKPHRISLNGDMNPYAFLITYMHELAHLIVQELHGRKAKPHGGEWKQVFRTLLNQFIGRGIFPEELEATVETSMANLRANTCSDPHLTKALRRYDVDPVTGLMPDDGIIWLDDIPDETVFALRNGKHYRKGKKRRTRYQCVDVKTKRIYLIHGMAEVKLIA